MAGPGSPGAGAGAGQTAANFERESELLPRDLPPLVLRALAAFLTVAVVAATAIAILVPFPETVTSPFLLQPQAGADPVKAPISGTIEKIAVVDGSQVKEGDVLFVIHSDDLGVLAERVKRLEAEQGANRPLDDAMRDKDKAALRAAETRARSLTAEIQYAVQRKESSKKLLGIAEESARSKLISEAELLAARQVDADSGQALERLRREAEDARALVAQLQANTTQSKAERTVQSTRLEGELAEARASLAMKEQSMGGSKLSATQIPILAPYDGVVTGMGPRRADTIIERGEVLCKVARLDGKLRAELSIAELEAGRVALGQPVKLLLDAYPYTRFGTKAATVAWVSPTAQEGTFRSFATLLDTSVMVDGVSRPLRAGMGGKAHIITGKRTLMWDPLESTCRHASLSIL